MEALRYRMKSLHLCLLAGILLPLSFALYASDHKDAKKLLDAGKILPLETILKKLPEEENKRVIEVELEEKKGLWFYEIEVIDGHGVVKEYVFDATDGKLLKQKRED